MRRESQDLKTTPAELAAELELELEAQRAYAKKLVDAEPIVTVFEIRGDERSSIAVAGMTREDFDRSRAELARLLSEWRRAR